MEKNARILVIDDDATTTTLLSAKLSEQGHSVMTASDGNEGLEKYKTFRPDIIILDIVMPRMDGHTFVYKFKEIGSIRETPIIVLTSHDARQGIFEIHGINDYIVKPFRMGDLLRKIDRRLQMKCKKILVVDDETDMISVIETRLKASGYDVITASDGLEGLEKARNEKPDLVILDVMMPKLDGYKVCRMLKFDTKYKNMSVILLTAIASDQESQVGRNVGADAYLTKPCDSAVLLHTIKELLWD